MSRLTRVSLGGSAGNRQLTSLVAALLVLLLAIEGATLFRLGSLLTVHAFVGMLLIPVVALKLASTGWRMLRYYLGADEYTRQGPPHLVLRALVAPVVVVSTVVLFATGVTLLVLGQTSGTVVGLHKASFVVWLGATGVHVLAHATKLPSFLRAGSEGQPSASRSSPPPSSPAPCSRPRRCRQQTDCKTALPPRSGSTPGSPHVRPVSVASVAPVLPVDPVPAETSRRVRGRAGITRSGSSGARRPSAAPRESRLG